MTAVTIAFIIGALVAGPAWVLIGAIIADTLTAQRRDRRRHNIDVHGTDAVEAWLADIDWPTRHANGTPFEEDEVA